MPESSHASETAPDYGALEEHHVEAPSDGFDSDEFREFLLQRDRRRTRPRRFGRGDDSEDGSTSDQFGDTTEPSLEGGTSP